MFRFYSPFYHERNHLKALVSSDNNFCFISALVTSSFPKKCVPLYAENENANRLWHPAETDFLRAYEGPGKDKEYCI
jgi:hypothetical protein